MSSCSICGRVVVDGSVFCHYHEEALDNIRSSYENWRKASDVSWEEYIQLLRQIDETGRWVREVAEEIKLEDDSSAPT